MQFILDSARTSFVEFLFLFDRKGKSQNADGESWTCRGVSGPHFHEVTLWTQVEIDNLIFVSLLTRSGAV